ncbi:family 1 polysaccharide lyase [Cryphonectria parasitica EP155]|uniref:pectin lyase n=1 Tax=Cryphonectria parasitica (strain ATCC 38755 / EP155) TaxID=660469 RepID=A0A9P5CN76_CRYP1|nr:family 1 polysaccharide lyase [Cryphonectria parasitica EP155]KAF3764883.1 family 1 polysaccharide lyase [Cryphonectria parasitica EP155]
MRSPSILLGTALVATRATEAVVGSPEGFAAATTGGAGGSTVYPTTTDELVSYLSSSEALTIVLQQTFDFTDTDGEVTATGCAPWGTGSACQEAINQDDWCTNYEPDAPSVTVEYYPAATLGITITSDKSLIGSGSSGVIKGRGLRIVSGASNVIIQNIEITDLNPKYVWGGDAITLDDCDLVWIDHVTISQIGRQQIVLGTEADARVSITYNNFDGTSSYSADCDTYAYWGLFFDGSDDLVTLKGNYIHHFSGRSPKVEGNTLLHAVNNYWYDYSSEGHAFEIGTGAYVLVEGSVFQNVPTILDADPTGEYFTSPSTTANEACAAYLGRDCQVNGFGSSGTFSSSTTSFFSDFEGKTIASAETYQWVQEYVIAGAGVGVID